MGLLEKYVGYRVLTGGGRGNGSGGGGDAGIVVVLIVGVLAAFLAVAFAIQWLVAAVADTIYATVRPPLLVAPHLTTVGLGTLIAAAFAKTVVPYPSETASAVLRSTDEGGSYYGGAAVAAITMTACLLVVVVTPTSLERNALLNVVWAAAMLYGLYKFCQVLWRTHRLAGLAPRGLAYSVALLTPLTTGLLVDTFHVPTAYPRLYYAAWLPGALVVVAAVIVKYRVEPWVQTRRTGPTYSSPAPSDG